MLYGVSDEAECRAARVNIDSSNIASDTPAGIYPVLTHLTYTTMHISSILDTPLPSGHIYRINTGAPLPLGADAVVMVEDTELVSTSPEDDKEEKEVRLLTQVVKGENVRMRGSDVKKGEKVLEKGMRISEVGGEIGTMAFVGKKEVRVVLPLKRREYSALRMLRKRHGRSWYTGSQWWLSCLQAMKLQACIHQRILRLPICQSSTIAIGHRSLHVLNHMDIRHST